MKVVNVIRGRDNLIRSIEFTVFQHKLSCTVTVYQLLIIPFQIIITVERGSKRPRRVAAVNADIKRKLTTEII